MPVKAPWSLKGFVLLVTAGVMALLVWRLPLLFSALDLNLGSVELHKVCLSMDEPGFENEGELRDGIPDGWLLNNWGGSRQIQSLDYGEKHGGRSSARIEKTNGAGAASFHQVVEIEGGGQHLLRGYARGSGGNLTLKYIDERGEYLSEGAADVYIPIPAGADWEKFERGIVPPIEAAKAHLWLVVSGAGHVTWFDDLFLGEESGSGQSLDNRLLNAGFEEDGRELRSLADFSRMDGEKVDLDASQAERLQRSEKFFQKALEWNPQNVWAYQGLSRVFFARREYSLCIETLRRMQKICERPGASVRWLVAQGKKDLFYGKLVSAEKSFKLAIALSPDYGGSYEALGELYAQRRGVLKAITAYHRALELGVERAGQVYFKLGRIYLSQTGEMDKATVALQRAVERLWEMSTWEKVAAYYDLGLALKIQQRFPEAEEAFQKVLWLAPESYWQRAAAEAQLVEIRGKNAHYN